MDEGEIVNYFEQMVMDHIQRAFVRTHKIETRDEVLDIACIALNHLPPKYIRYRTDATFYKSHDELTEMQRLVEENVQKGYEAVITSPRR